MSFNWIGFASAAALFISVWFGHVAVRSIEARVRKLWLPIVLCLVLGTSLLYLSIDKQNNMFSAALGIVGMTILWDALEFIRQERRIKKGHAPANPDNPRHAEILASTDFQATSFDLLKRDPVGRQVDQDEARELIK